MTFCEHQQLWTPTAVKFKSGAHLHVLWGEARHVLVSLLFVLCVCLDWLCSQCSVGVDLASFHRPAGGYVCPVLLACREPCLHMQLPLSLTLLVTAGVLWPPSASAHSASCTRLRLLSSCWELMRWVRLGDIALCQQRAMLHARMTAPAATARLGSYRLCTDPQSGQIQAGLMLASLIQGFLRPDRCLFCLPCRLAMAVTARLQVQVCLAMQTTVSWPVSVAAPCLFHMHACL